MLFKASLPRLLTFRHPWCSNALICNPGIHLLVESHNPDIYWNRKCLQLKGCLIVEHIFPLLHSQLIGIFQPLTSNLSAKLIDVRMFQNLQFLIFFCFIFHFIFIASILTFYEPFYSHIWSCFLLS